MKIKLFLVTMLLIVFTAGCGAEEKRQLQSRTEDKKLIVYASIYPVYDFAKNVGRDMIDLRQITPQGAEPHDYEPSPKLMADMEGADVLLYNGAGMEPWIHDVAGVLKGGKLLVVDTSEGADLIELGEHEEGEEGHEGLYDPHLWLNPLNAAKQAENIKDALIAADEKNKEYYEDNYSEFRDRLIALDEKYTEELKEFQEREIIVAHAAFGYLADRYGLKQIAIKGVTAQEEPSFAKMKEITKMMREKNIKYIFFEPLTNPEFSEVIARETGAKTQILNPIGGLTEDEINSGKDYVSVMEDNLKVLKEALGASL